MDQIPRIAAKYRAGEREELAAELAVALLELRQTPLPHVRNWKAYIYRCFQNRAARVAKSWRKVSGVESALTDDVSSIEPTSKIDLTTVYRRIANRERHLVKQLDLCDGNVSRLARLSGQHRNTIHRRLKKIRLRCPVEIESAPLSADRAKQEMKVRLAAITQSPGTSTGHRQRARVIQELLDGRTYAEINAELGVSPSTIACCRRRFDSHGVDGLVARHPGRKPSASGALLRQFLRHNKGARPSLRGLGRRFGLGKSAVADAFSSVGNGALRRRKIP